MVPINDRHSFSKPTNRPVAKNSCCWQNHLPSTRSKTCGKLSGIFPRSRIINVDLCDACTFRNLEWIKDNLFLRIQIASVSQEPIAPPIAVIWFWRSVSSLQSWFYRMLYRYLSIVLVSSFTLAFRLAVSPTARVVLICPKQLPVASRASKRMVCPTLYLSYRFGRSACSHSSYLAVRLYATQAGMQRDRFVVRKRASLEWDEIRAVTVPSNATWIPYCYHLLSFRILPSLT